MAAQVTQMERETVAAMFTIMGYPERAQKIIEGRWSNYRLLGRLAEYRESFERGEVDHIQDARNLAADMEEELADGSNLYHIVGPGLRKGFEYAWPPSRAFAYHHRRLAKGKPPPAVDFDFLRPRIDALDEELREKVTTGALRIDAAEACQRARQDRPGHDT